MTDYIRPSDIVTDTMALVLWLERRKLPLGIKTMFELMEAGETTIHVPTMVLAEMLYLSEKKRIRVTFLEVLVYLEQQQHCTSAPMTVSVLRASSEISDIPELHDRLIAGTSRSLGLTLITNDPLIQKSRFTQTIW